MYEYANESGLQKLHQVKNTSQSTDGPKMSSRSQCRRLYPYPVTVYPPYFILMIVLLCAPTSNGIPSFCHQPPPSPNCDGESFNGLAYFYNRSSVVPCMHMFDWGCEGDNIFPSIEECMATCQPETPAPTNTVTSPPTLSPEEICALPINNFICGSTQPTDLWVYRADKKRCNGIRFFNCEEVPDNMFETEEECISTCGRFSPHYSHLFLEPSLSSSLPSIPTSTPTPSSSLDYHFIAVTTYPTVTPTNEPTHSQSPPSDTTDPTSAFSDPPPPTDIPLTITLPTSDRTDPITTSDPSDVEVTTSQPPTDRTDPSTTSDSHIDQGTNSDNSRLAIFDIASIGVGASFLILVLVLLIVVISLVHRRRVFKKRLPSSVTETHISATNHCKSNGDLETHFAHHVTNHSCSYYV